jgi:hypothetical protein
MGPVYFQIWVGHSGRLNGAIAPCSSVLKLIILPPTRKTGRACIVIQFYRKPLRISKTFAIRSFRPVPRVRSSPAARPPGDRALLLPGERESAPLLSVAPPFPAAGPSPFPAQDASPFPARRDPTLPADGRLEQGLEQLAGGGRRNGVARPQGRDGRAGEGRVADLAGVSSSLPPPGR